jgi:membrane associated rhomboid family serine protease
MFYTIREWLHRNNVLSNRLYALIAINVVVFLSGILLNIIELIARGPHVMWVESLQRFFGMPGDARVFLTRPWGIVTSLFVHQDVFHILFNMLFVYVFGNIFSFYLGHRRILWLYLFGGMSGCLLYLIGSHVLPQMGDISKTYCIGASAAATAIMVATAYKFPDQEIRLLLLGNVKIKYIVLVVLFMDFLAVSRMAANTGGHVAHIGGGIYGLVYIVLLNRGIDLSDFPKAIGAFFKQLFGKKVITPPKRYASMSVKVTRSQESTRAPRANAAREDDFQERLDAILDKIRLNGYGSLTTEEKNFLFEAGNRM